MKSISILFNILKIKILRRVIAVASKTCIKATLPIFFIYQDAAAYSIKESAMRGFGQALILGAIVFALILIRLLIGNRKRISQEFIKICFYIKKLINPRNIKFAALTCSFASLIAIYLYFFPEVQVLSCKQSEGVSYNTVHGKIIHFESPPAAKKIVLKKYFGGLVHTLNEYEMSECETTSDFIVCKDRFSEYELNRYTGLFFYFGRESENYKTTYLGWQCKKSEILID